MTGLMGRDLIQLLVAYKQTDPKWKMLIIHTHLHTLACTHTHTLTCHTRSKSIQKCLQEVAQERE